MTNCNDLFCEAAFRIGIPSSTYLGDIFRFDELSKRFEEAFYSVLEEKFPNEVVFLELFSCVFSSLKTDKTLVQNLLCLSDYGLLTDEHRIDFDIIIDQLFRLGFLNHVDGLDLSHCGLDKIPYWALDFTGIKYLSLSCNKFTEIPKELVTTFSCLQRLELERNSIENIPDSISELCSLKYLNLSGNRLTELPNISLFELEKLDVSSNNISKVPDGLGNLYNLRKLNVTMNNNLDQEEIFSALDKLSNFVEVDVARYVKVDTGVSEEMRLLEEKGVVLKRGDGPRFECDRVNSSQKTRD